MHDETGNSRFWSVPVTDADFTHAIDVQQLWAEVMRWYRGGERHWLDRDEQEILTRRNRDHTAPDVIRELLEAAINDGAHESTWLDTTPSDYLRRCGFSTTKSAATVIGMLFRERGYSVVGTTSNKAAIYRVPPPMDPR